MVAVAVVVAVVVAAVAFGLWLLFSFCSTNSSSSKNREGDEGVKLSATTALACFFLADDLFAVTVRRLFTDEV